MAQNTGIVTIVITDSNIEILIKFLFLSIKYSPSNTYKRGRGSFNGKSLSIITMPCGSEIKTNIPKNIYAGQESLNLLRKIHEKYASIHIK